jgi:phenylacetic acid degradation operon negative regulatory protein
LVDSCNIRAVKPTAKRIILELLSATDGHEAASSSLVAAGKLLGVAETSVRVTLTRLVADGTLELTGRGSYRLGDATAALTRQVTSWRELEKQVRRWDGAWVCVQAGSSGGDRSLTRRRGRALRLLGFRALDHTPGHTSGHTSGHASGHASGHTSGHASGRTSGQTSGHTSWHTLSLRPDNLDGGVAALRERLYALGVEDEALVFRATELDGDTDARARRLWDAERLTQAYHQTRDRIDRWLHAVTELPLRTAAREAFFFGGDVLRMILFDPRLPEPLVDVAARRALVEAGKRLDAAGRVLWAQLFGMQHGLVITPEHHDELELS